MSSIARALGRFAVFAAILTVVWPVASVAVARVAHLTTDALETAPSSYTAPHRTTAPASAIPVDPRVPSSASRADSSGPSDSGDTVPRSGLVSQFDGGRFQNVNCTLAAGAMLADTQFGIVTTGSILRELQFDQTGGTDLDDLAVALRRGYGVAIVTGQIGSSDLQALLTRGLGVVTQGDYSALPEEFRLQSDFTGDHAVYVDIFYPGDSVDGPSYLVIDPIGRGGYRGQWWPAHVFVQFANAFTGGDSISAAWAPIR
jgi:hypothetical protein